jgi:hypothetical protein
MSESEVRALIRSELSGLGIKPESVDAVVSRIMDAVAEYASERASDEAHWAVVEYEERM